MDKRPRRRPGEAHSDFVVNRAFFERLHSLGFIRSVDIHLLYKAAVELDVERADELTARLREEVQAFVFGIDLDILNRAINGDSDSITKVSQLLLDETREKRDLEKSGVSHTVGQGLEPGLVMAPSDINVLAVEMLQACQSHYLSPPKMLVELITVQLKADARSRRQAPQTNKKFNALFICWDNPEISARRLADLVGVSHDTAAVWLRDPEFQAELERWRSANPLQRTPKDDQK